MTDWWSNDPIASAPTPPAAPNAPSANWWEQDATIMPAPKAAPPVDPIKAQVRKEIEEQKAAGIGQGMGAARTFVQGATLGTADEILAGLMTPVNMIKRGTLNPATAYAYAKAKEDALLEDDRASSGIPGAIAEAAGGIGLGAGLYKAGASLAPAISSKLGSGLLGTAAGGVADGALYGAASGFAEGNGAERFGDAARSGLIGAGFGAALPLATAGVGALAAPIVSNVAARVNPSAYAERQIGRIARESGQTGDEVASRLQAALGDAQPEYRLIDALDNAGKRAGAVVAKNPGPGRQQLTEFLDARQADQGYRLSNTLAEGLDAPVTAQRATADLTSARGTAADAAYGQARADAALVDTSPALGRISGVLMTGSEGMPSAVHNIVPDSVESALLRAQRLLTDGDSTKVGFEAVQRVKGDLDDAVGKAVRAGENNKARLLGQVTRDLDASLEAASPSYSAARDAYRQGSRDIAAVETGTASAGRGRSEDKIAAFSGLAPSEQAGFRIGYADPLIAKTQNAAEGVNKARPLTSMSMQAELPAFAAPGRGDQMMRRIGRENEMFATRAKATGGSSTSENLSDNATTGVDMSVIGKLLSGEFFGAAKHALNRAGAGLNGNTEAVRENMARLLLRGNPDEVRTLLNQLAQARMNRSDTGATALRSFFGGAVPAISRPAEPSRR